MLPVAEGRSRVNAVEFAEWRRIYTISNVPGGRSARVGLMNMTGEDRHVEDISFPWDTWVSCYLGLRRTIRTLRDRTREFCRGVPGNAGVASDEPSRQGARDDGWRYDNVRVLRHDAVRVGPVC